MIDVGVKFGRWTVVASAPKSPTRRGRRWLCRCQCGNEIIVAAANLKSAHSKGCAECNRRRLRDNPPTAPSKITHGLSHTRLYGIWDKMKDRCGNPKCDHFKWYGARGIRVCDAWVGDFMIFRAWALANGYEDHLTIDRRDNDGNYEPTNCRWVTHKEQARNRPDNVRYEYQGEMLVLADIAARCPIDIDPSVLRGRLVRCGWSMETATTKPVRPKKPNQRRMQVNL